MNIQNIPSHWEIKKMPGVVKWGSGGTPKATEKQYYENGTIPWLIIGDLNDGIVTKSESKITKLGLENSSAKMIPAGTLLVAMYGSIGKLGITGIECCTNQAIAYAKELYGVTTKYIQRFCVEEIFSFINRLRNKRGTFYNDREIWNSLCRVERGKVSNKMRFSIYERDGYRCRRCGVSERYATLEIDHIIPISKGGKSTYENLQTLCRKCNYEKGNKRYY